ncbi:KpsF/GutQ family sugar-phosphate isomerase [Sporolactobacillus terrae]|uniref:KpsF/GutQ family sugar-phosphate isomerase n=1 Tax=Sporolactobacillus terrae TaxID=269673 RepID=UPI00111A5D0F|nr:SIS domain-containing protein [Sporolactobacillus terrae]UAK16392.1 SIS domain-containing protein [Sporolactobacillus terrae]
MTAKYDQLLKKVINQEIISLQNIETKINQEYNQVIDAVLNTTGKVIFLGVGKSGHIGKKLAATFASTGTPSFFVHATEAVHGDLGMIEKDDLVVAISNSGETKEVLNTFVSLKIIGCKVIALTGNRESSLAKKSDLLLEVKVSGEADEYNLAPSNSSTAALVVGDAVALTVSHLKGFKPNDFAVFHPGGALGKRLLGEEL